jgi:hypothetical protein
MITTAIDGLHQTIKLEQSAYTIVNASRPSSPCRLGMNPIPAPDYQDSNLRERLAVSREK